MSKKRILVADDETEICSLIEHALTAEGYVVDCVYDGKSALEKLKKETFDAVILDVMMPHVDGYHITYRIKTMAAGPVPKIIILSSRDKRVDENIGQKSGADIQLMKPFEPSQLVQTVRQLLE
ncbi:MAG: response regulator [Elusimicrobia bacterium]|nr:response regulator [Elusimicrobiota bacterium]